MGLLIKVPLLFDGARLGLNDNEWMNYDIPDNATTQACFFITWPFGYDYVFGNIGGRFGWELSQAGPEATVDLHWKKSSSRSAAMHVNISSKVSRRSGQATR